jgi:hypothetical protein
MAALVADAAYQRELQGTPPHRCCQRQLNQMRISPLEARAIALAFERDPQLRAKLDQVRQRLEKVLPRLRRSTARQNFDCPLLEGTRCLVHHSAKPIGCAAWNPRREFSEDAWEAFARRDELNDQIYGPRWKLHVIPLWLERVLPAEVPNEPARPPEIEAIPSSTGSADGVGLREHGRLHRFVAGSTGEHHEPAGDEHDGADDDRHQIALRRGDLGDREGDEGHGNDDPADDLDESAGAREAGSAARAANRALLDPTLAGRADEIGHEGTFLGR